MHVVSGSKGRAGVDPPDFPTAKEVEAFPMLVDDLSRLLYPAADAALLLVDVCGKPCLDAHSCHPLGPRQMLLTTLLTLQPWPSFSRSHVRHPIKSRAHTEAPNDTPSSSHIWTYIPSNPPHPPTHTHMSTQTTDTRDTQVEATPRRAHCFRLQGVVWNAPVTW